MRIHYLQHVASEGIGRIGDWACQNGHSTGGTHLYLGEALPDVDAIDWLVIMGGPMNIYEYRNHPGLREEKRFIERAISSGKTVLGICLGAQLVADVLGAKIYQNPEIEIGWFPVRFGDNRKSAPAFEKFPAEMTVLHWHGDTFDLPGGAMHLAESDGCTNQAFAFGRNVIGLQFHIEVGAEEVADWFDDPVPASGRFIQTREQIAKGGHHAGATRTALNAMLDALAAG